MMVRSIESVSRSPEQPAEFQVDLCLASNNIRVIVERQIANLFNFRPSPDKKHANPTLCKYWFAKDANNPSRLALFIRPINLTRENGVVRKQRGIATVLNIADRPQYIRINLTAKVKRGIKNTESCRCEVLGNGDWMITTPTYFELEQQIPMVEYPRKQEEPMKAQINPQQQEEKVKQDTHLVTIRGDLYRRLVRINNGIRPTRLVDSILTEYCVRYEMDPSTREESQESREKLMREAEERKRKIEEKRKAEEQRKEVLNSLTPEQRKILFPNEN